VLRFWLGYTLGYTFASKLFSAKSVRPISRLQSTLCGRTRATAIGQIDEDSDAKSRKRQATGIAYCL